MSKLVGSFKMCIFCRYGTNRAYNLTRHIHRKHVSLQRAERQKLLTEGEFKCPLHSVPMVYLKRHQLKRHLYFCHIADPEESLSVHGISGQLIEQLGYKCRGSSFEYAWVRTDFERYCEAHESDKQAFLNFLSLNKHYEEK
jgi:hypothetical protein